VAGAGAVGLMGALLVIECTGAPSVITQAVAGSAPGGIVCLTGIGGGHPLVSFDVATLNQSLVLENSVVFGSVNANRRHYEAAAHALAHAERSWLERIITRRLPLQQFEEAYLRAPGDVKTVLLFED
jgi:threonine dehydrogenase-like Zn-dependent dehydrogenase